MPHTEIATVALASDGDSDAFQSLVERHSRAVFRLAHRMTGNAADAEDVVQDTFLKAYKQLGRFESRANFGTWLHRIAVNCSIDLIRSRPHKEAHRHQREQNPEPSTASSAPSARCARRSSPSASFSVRAISTMRVGYAGQRQFRTTRRASAHQTQGNAVALARKEQDMTMKTEMVKRLSNMDSKEARDYMVELLK